MGKTPGKSSNLENGKNVENAEIEEKPEVNHVIQEMVATDFFIVHLDYHLIAKSGHLKGQSGSWASNATFLDDQGGHLGHCIIYMPRNDNFDQTLVKGSFGVRECSYYLVLGTPYSGLPATL